MMHSLLYYTAQGLIAAPISAWIILTISDGPGTLDVVTVFVYGVAILAVATVVLLAREAARDWLKKGG